MLVAMSTMRLSEAIAAYGEALESRALSAHTRKAFANDVKLFGVAMIERISKDSKGKDGADVKAASVTAEHIREWLRDLEHGEKHAPKSIERRLTSVKAFFRWLHEQKHIRRDPAEVVAYQRLVDPLPAYLSEDDVQRVLAAARAWAKGEKLDQRPLTAIMLVLDTGIKKNECVRLHTGDVLIGSVGGRAKRNGAGGEIHVRYPQRHMKFKERRLAIGAACAAQLAAHIKQYGHGPLFDCTDRNLEYLIDRHVAPAAGVARLTFEMLRWTCAMRMRQEGEQFAGQMQTQFGLSDMGWMEMRAKLERLREAEERKRQGDRETR